MKRVKTMTSEKDKEIARLTRAIKLETDDRLKEKYIKRKAAIENGEMIIKEKDRFENKKYHRPIKNMNVAKTIEKPSIIKRGFQKIISFLRSFIFLIFFLAIGGGLKLVYDFLFQPVHLFDWKSSLMQGGFEDAND